MIHKTTRSILSVLLAALLLVTSTPLIPAFAGEEGAVSLQSESGEGGELTGSGAKENPYQIGSAAELREFAELVNGGKTDASAVLTDDINLNPDMKIDEDGTVTNGAVTNQKELREWTPIGTNSSRYSGTFDGDGHTISGLYIDSTADYQGLFGYVDTGGTVKDLGVSGSVSGNNYVGGVVGYNSGHVKNCYNTGSVSGNSVGGVVGYNSGSVTNCYNIGDVSGSKYVGGVVGYNYSGGSVTNSYNTGAVSGGADVGGVVGLNSGNVENCYNTGTVSGPDSGTSNYVGGVVGQNHGSVTNCYNTGTVSGPDSGTSNYVGGVVGWNISSGIVTNCYNTGAVSGGEDVGGVVGYNSGIVENCYNTGSVTSSGSPVGGVVGQNWSIVTNCYNTGAVSGGEDVGGVVGWNISSGNVTNCYFLQQNGVPAQGIGSGSGSATPLSAEKFESQESFTSWDFASTWEIESIFGRPTLQDNAEIGGTANNPYKIFTATQLAAFRDLVNCANDQTADPDAHAKLMNNIDLSSVCGESNSWTPIGTSEENAYTGTFNGNNYTISGLYIDTTTNYQGFFGVLGQGGIVQNLSVSGTVKGSGIHVGGVVGQNFGGSVENCYNIGKVTGSADSSNVGGVVGDNRGTVENCYNTGNISGGNQVGGVVGRNFGGNVKNCYNTGEVSGTSNYVGGVVGENRKGASVINCYFLKTADVNENLSGIGGGSGSGDAAAKDGTAFHSGEVAWRLQSKQTAAGEGEPALVWGQSALGTEDSLPTLVALNPDAAQPVYKVTFKYGYEGAPEEKISYSNGSVEFPAFERTGYTFAGWTPTGTTISQDTTFTAQWTANTYTVTLHTNDGTIAEDQNVTTYTYGIGATLPTTVTREGYTFEGWYEKEDLTGDPVTEIGKDAIGDKAYWAKWKANEYKVTLHTNDGTIAEGQNISSYTYGIGATLPTSVTREGYTFAGWYEKEDFTGDPVAAIGIDAMGDKAYWAKWEEVENPDPDPDPIPTPDPTPSGPSTGDSTGWDDIRDELENAAKGDEITIDMGDETKVPAEIFETLAGQDITLEIALEGGVTWSVNGQDIPADANLSDLDLGVEMNSDGIPVDVVNSITGERDTVQMTLAHDGDFGFTMTLTAPLGVENAGYWANLYHYDEDAEQLTFETAAEIDADGSVSLPMSHASQYAIVIDTHSHATVDVSDLFSDIAPDAWYKDAVQYAYDNGLMTGVSATEFAPEQTTTRAMIVSILARLENVTTAEAAGFADVNDEWYATAVNWAANVGVVNGYEDNTFRPNTAITREQLAAILMNYAAYKGEDVSARADLSAYTDQPSTWATDTMSWAVAEGLISGVTNDELRPQGNATRAQVAAILQRLLEA